METKRINPAGADLRADPATDLPAGTPSWITAGLVALTREVWGPRYNDSLTIDECIAMIRGAGALTRVLSCGGTHAADHESQEPIERPHDDPEPLADPACRYHGGA